MPKIHLLLRGPAAAPYPNGGDEAYWMGQVAGALASHLGQEGIPLEWGPPQEEDALCLTLSSQAAPPKLEGQKRDRSWWSGRGMPWAGKRRRLWPSS